MRLPLQPAMLSAAAAAGSLAVVYCLYRRRHRGHTTTSSAACKESLPTSIPRVGPAAQEIAEAVRSHGVCIVESVLDAEAINLLRERLAQIEPRKRQNRRQHRWELVHSPEDAPLAELATTEPIGPAVRALLGPKTYLEKAGMIVSHVGSEAQRWHMDVPHLFSLPQHLPPQSLSIFVPLCELVTSNGPTEFQLATHIKANLVKPIRHALATCPAGSFVIYDPRIMHRGGANRSESGADRPLVYLTVSRIWYRDTLNP
jgi:ectoine hydroxylase-related dioxygenase (phytanoyl-CoA dioxygenase family)